MCSPDYEDYRKWKTWSADKFGECTLEEAAYFDLELRKSAVGDLQGKQVVEIGFGNGSFASWSREHGAEYAGTELIPELQSLARRSGIRVLDEGSPLAGQIGAGTIDLVVAFDVLEHIEPGKLPALLTDLHRCLRSGGCVIARVPSGDSPFSGAIQNGDLTHSSVLGSSAVRQIAKSAGFADVTTREPVLPLSGAGCLGAFRRILVRTARRVLYPVIAKVLMGGGSPVLSPNMLFVLRRP